MMQMTMMATPNINKELHYLNKEDRLLRWLLVKHRTTQYGIDYLNEEQTQLELSRWPRSRLYDDELDHVDPEVYLDNDDAEYQVDEEGEKKLEAYNDNDDEDDNNDDDEDDDNDDEDDEEYQLDEDGEKKLD